MFLVYFTRSCITLKADEEKLSLLQNSICPAPLGNNARVPVDVGSGHQPHTSSHLPNWHMDPRAFLKAKCTFTQAHPISGEHDPSGVSGTVIS